MSEVVIPTARPANNGRSGAEPVQPVAGPLDFSPDASKLFDALAAVQARLRPVVAAEEAKIKTDKANYSYHYADLAAVWEVIRAPLAENGLAVLQIPSSDGARVSVRTVLGHKSGQWAAGTLTMAAANASPQAVGSAITYARRYALGAFLGLAVTEDDDGRAAQPATAGAAKKESQKAAPAKKVTDHMNYVARLDGYLRKLDVADDGELAALVAKKLGCDPRALHAADPDAATKAAGESGRALFARECSARMEKCEIPALADALALAKLPAGLAFATMTWEQLEKLLTALRETPAAVPAGA